jgi:hypothetical protein
MILQELGLATLLRIMPLAHYARRCPSLTAPCCGPHEGSLCRRNLQKETGSGQE